MDLPNPPMLPVHSFFQVRISAERCAYDIRLNDATIWADTEANPIDGALPVNHWVSHGNNLLEVRLSPPSGEQRFDDRANCRVTFTVRTANAPQSSGIVLTEISFPSPLATASEHPPSILDADPRYLWPDPRAVTPLVVQTGDSRASYILLRQVALASPFPRWAWLDADPLEESEQTFKELFARYENFWHDLRAKRLADVRAALSFRSNEFAAAYYRLAFEILDDLGIDRSATDPGLELYPLDTEPKLEIFGNKRLARITRWDGEPLLVFVQREKQLSTYYDLVFCKRNGQWQIIR
jgi:hypothetical protein